VIYFIAMIANPIFINTIVVFVRLYWFEKRFQHIVHVVRSKSGLKSGTIHPRNINEDEEERGVDGRNIIVLHPVRKLLGPGMGGQIKDTANKGKTMVNSSATADNHKEGYIFNEKLHKSSEEPEPPIPELGQILDEISQERVPEQQTPGQHISFLENQRSPKDMDALRIPGPLEFDRGQVPEKIQHNDGGDSLCRKVTGSADQHSSPIGRIDRHEHGYQPDTPRPNRNITVEALEEPQTGADSSQPKMTLRRTATNRSTNQTFLSPRKWRGTFSSPRTTSSRFHENMPYLSWEATIGRNSVFVDLTEEQREELGGIEYRSLKTLAAILVCELP
jgi:hypothetical protein